MIDERQEELASLYALDLLEGAERARFETALARDPALQALVRELRESANALAHAAPAIAPPAEVKTRVLASIAPANRTARSEPRVIRFPFLPWAIAAGFAVLAAWLGSSYRVAQAQANLLRDQNVLAETAARVERVRAEARQIIASRQVADLEKRAMETQQKMEALAASSGQISRQLAETRNRVDTLTAELRTQGDIAEFKVATLVSMLNHSPEARAIAVWNPAKQEGLFALDKAPPIEPGQKLELWVIEAKDGAQPVSAGVLAVNADGTLKARFKPSAAVGAIATFAVSREKDDGVRFHAKPAEVVMAGGSR